MCVGESQDHQDVRLTVDLPYEFQCVRNDDVTIVKRLLTLPDAEKLANQADDSTQTPLHYAAKATNLLMCELLIGAGSS